MLIGKVVIFFYAPIYLASNYRFILKPLFHCKLGSSCVTNVNEISTNNMKCTWPTQKFCIWDPRQPIFHWLVLGFCIGGNANFMFCVRGNANFCVFRYQHVDIPNAKL